MDKYTQLTFLELEKFLQSKFSYKILEENKIEIEEILFLWGPEPDFNYLHNQNFIINNTKNK